jgi:ADP-ribose pyrophosphatase
MDYKKQVFKGKLLNVFVKKEKLPNGYLASLEVVKHPGAALIIPFLTANKTILLKQYRPVINSYIYELPAGTLNKNETPIKCARREIVEEIGYSAKKISKLGVIFPVPGYSTEKITIFKADGLKKEKINIQEDEVIHPFIATKKEVKQLFRRGKIIDAKTIAAFAMCGWL